MYKIDLREEYKRVVSWNIKAGKLPVEITYPDILKQKALVDEEVAEFLIEQEKYEPTGNLLKELCDVFVTACYLDFLQLMEVDEEISLSKASEVMHQVWSEESIMCDTEEEADEMAEKLAKNIGELPNLKLVLMAAIVCEMDIKAALNEVLDNNDLKLYDTISAADEQLLLLGDENKYFVDCNIFGGRDFFCVKRIEDGKVMESKSHPKVSLDKYLEV